MNAALTRACWCKTFPGCRNAPEAGSARHLCSICRESGHKAYTAAQIERYAAKAKEAR